MENEQRRSYDVSDETKKVNSSDWPTMTVNELMEQKVILFERAQVVAHMGKTDMLQQINSSLARLDMLIKRKSSGGGTTVI